MIKIFACIAVALLFGIAVGFAYFNSTKSSTSVSREYDLAPLPCDLLKKPCSVDFLPVRAAMDSANADSISEDSMNLSESPQKITFDIEPRPVIVMEKSRIRISNLAYDFYDPKLRIHGLNMDMGTIIASLVEVSPHVFETNVALSACLVKDVMRYRIAVYDGNEALNLFMDFDIER